MHRVGFEPMIPVFEQAKKVHALDLAATVSSTCLQTCSNVQCKGTVVSASTVDMSGCPDRSSKTTELNTGSLYSLHLNLQNT
jgi:hypothetical protein